MKLPCKNFRNLQMSHLKKLAAFDFDNTIVNDNTDTVVRSLLPKNDRPPYQRGCWTAHMQKVFELLHIRNIGETTIRRSVREIQPITGMCELIKELSENLNYDVIIISDSNSYFISNWLDEQNITSNIKSTFTNPAVFVDGLLKIQMYHEQDWCNLSEKNLCKGFILDNFIKTQNNAGISYNKIVYIGDGLNDFCPILHLKRNSDLACCRDGFKCAELVSNCKMGKPFRDNIYNIKADVFIWKNGFDILNKLKN